MRSIRSRLTLSFLLLAVITLALTGTVLFATTRHLARQLEREALQRTAGDLLPRMQRILESEADEDDISDLIGLAEALGRVELRFVGPAGEVELPAAMADRLRREAEMGAGSVHSPQMRRPGGGPMADRFDDRDDTIRLSLTDGPYGGYLEVTDRADLAGQLTRLTLLGFLVSAVVTLGASALISILVGRSLTRPIVTLTNTVATMHDGDMDARVAVSGDDEIGTLGRRFNEMADRLRDTFRALRDERDTLRTFTADASHELRTPLTAITTGVELLQKEPGSAAQTELLADMAAQARRMARTIAELLLLSRLDGGVADLAQEPVELNGVIRGAWDQVTRARPEATVHFVLEDTSDAARRIRGDAGRLRTLFANLFENSLNAITGSGEVRCVIDDIAAGRRVRVVDNGGGIPAADLPHVLRRFYRSPQNTGQGSGLGLSIAAAIAQAHGASLEVVSPPSADAPGALRALPSGAGRGTEVRIMFPAPSPGAAASSAAAAPPSGAQAWADGTLPSPGFP